MAKSKPKEKEAGLKTLEDTIDAINKRYGSGTVMMMGDQPKQNVAVVPTGSLSLDIALGIGGIPRGRMTEIIGSESAGKTTMGLHAIAEAQKTGGKAAFIDAEHSLDLDYASHIGVDVDKLYLSQPSCGEEAMDILSNLIDSRSLDIVIIDSVAALVPRAEIEGEIGDSHVGLLARLMSQSMRMLTGPIALSKTAVVFINQLRMKIGVMYGSPETTPGGRALKFYTSVRIDVRPTAKLKKDSKVYGSRVRAKVIKNKLAPPYAECEFDLVHGMGIARMNEIVELGAGLGVIVKKGAWYSYEDKNIGQGVEASAAFLTENPETAMEVEVKIHEAIRQTKDHRTSFPD